MFASASAVALAVMLASLANAPRELTWLIALGAAGVLAVTVTRIVRALNALYRCPHCGAIPYQTLNEYKCGGLGPTCSNFMSPTHCPKCGTRLR